MNAILDAGPMVAFLGGEEGGDVVRGLLADPTTTCYCHAVSIIEVYYHFLRISDEETAERVISDLIDFFHKSTRCVPNCKERQSD